MAERAAAEVGARVPDEGADHDADDEVAAVGQLAQQHGVRERDADPRDAQERHRDRGRAAPGLEQGQPERQRHRADEHEEHLVGVPEVRGDHEPDERGEAGQPGRVRLGVHPEQLVQADEAEEREEGGERRAAEHDEQQRQRGGRDPDEDPLLQVRAHRPPNRRARWPKAPSARSNASAVKSGQSSGAKTSSEYALCQSRKFESRSSPLVRMTTSGSCMSGA